MRLFLASQDFGKYADRLSEMVGENRRALVVFNARDYKEDEGLEKQQNLFADNNFEFHKLDLRDYFGRTEELRGLIDKYSPGQVVLLGGNTFLLRRALAQSGFDEMIKSDIAADKYVLAGHSAGSIVAGPSLEGFERLDNQHVLIPGYDPGVIWSGLGLTDTRIIPHVSRDIYRQQITAIREQLFDANGWRYVELNDDEVFVVNGDKEEVLR